MIHFHFFFVNTEFLGIGSMFRSASGSHCDADSGLEVAARIFYTPRSDLRLRLLCTFSF